MTPGINGAIIGEDGLARPPWAAVDPMLRDYYDNEWGLPVRDEQGLYERISLEAFQAGLSWATILRKRPAFRAAFHDFRPESVAAFTEDDVERLMLDAGIVRNRLKIQAAITNARATLALRDDGGLVDFVWGFQPETTPEPSSLHEIPTTSAESVALPGRCGRKGSRLSAPPRCSPSWRQSEWLIRIYLTATGAALRAFGRADWRQWVCNGRW